ncbi:hypothetical protein [Azospirillum sp. ST 5-10]|uniref:hypothetical protein n=1 Tax=unclassified Azospirillum TaxID=2630922 RepID=UPI003F4A20E8
MTAPARLDVLPLVDRIGTTGIRLLSDLGDRQATLFARAMAVDIADERGTCTALRGRWLDLVCG